MRCRLKKTLQIIIVITCLILYINFILISKTSNLPNVEDYDMQNKDQNQANIAAVVTKNALRVQGEGKTMVPLTSFQNESKDQNQANIAAVVTKNALRFQGEGKTMVPLTSFQNESIYPSQNNFENDRILEQLNFIPPSIRAHRQSGQSSIPLKKIYLPSGIGGWAIKRGQGTFLEQKCAVPYCTITDMNNQMKDADVVLFDGVSRSNGFEKPANQIWMIFMLESPYHTPILNKYTGKFNWTATYRRDSTIVAPYEKFVPYNKSVLTKPQTKNYAAGKSKMVAWFVSNCGARNNRMKYATELAKHIQVDIYGRCGTLKCSRSAANKCFEMLNTDYRFYLSFENSNCRDYITEKFFVNGLKHDVIPIVMGGAPEDYKRAAPPHSHIHVDDFKSPKDMADYLHLLAKDEKLYNEYFQWKGTGDIINTYFWCRVCALAHDVDTRGRSWYHDLQSWWRGENICIGERSWRDVKGRSNVTAPLSRWQPQLAKHLL